MSYTQSSTTLQALCNICKHVRIGRTICLSLRSALYLFAFAVIRLRHEASADWWTNQAKPFCSPVASSNKCLVVAICLQTPVKILKNLHRVLGNNMHVACR